MKKGAEICLVNHPVCLCYYSEICLDTFIEPSIRLKYSLWSLVIVKEFTVIYKYITKYLLNCIL